jgi:hypothetical protein
VLLFANSVEHAQHLAARLCFSGVPFHESVGLQGRDAASLDGTAS